MTGDLPAPTAGPARSGRLRLTGPQVEQRSLAPDAAVVECAPELVDLCARRDLGEVGRLAASRADQAAATQQPYTAYLTDLLQAEADARQQHYITSRTQMAHLPFQKTLDTFDFAFQPSIDERQVRELATLQWVDAAAHVVALAPPGGGGQNPPRRGLGARRHPRPVLRVLRDDSGSGGGPAQGLARESLPRAARPVHPAQAAVHR